MPQQDQLVRTAIEAEPAPRQVVDVFVVVAADREDPVAAALERIAQRLWRAFENRTEVAPFEPAPSPAPRSQKR